MTTTARYEQQVDIETPEQVVVSYTIAGIGARSAAALIDYATIGVAIVVLWVLLIMLARAISPGADQTADTTAAQSSGAWAASLVVLTTFALQWGYYVLFEALWDGQTPGKRRLGIRVVQDGGYSVSFAASAVRNIARVVDMQPGLLYSVGIVSAVSSRSGKRLGDMMAGTIVVRERVAKAAQPAIQEEAAGPELTTSLSDPDFGLLDRFVERLESLDADRRRTIAAHLVDRFRDEIGTSGSPPPASLLALHEREKAARAAGAAPRGATGAERERNAIVARGAVRWSAFATALAEAQRRGLRAMSEKEVSDFVASYREVATDLARLRTASRASEGGPALGGDALFYVSRLVGAGHNLLYRQRQLSWRSISNFLFVSMPRELRRSAIPILGAAVLLFGPMAVSYAVVTAEPALAERLLPPGMIDRAEEGAARARNGDKAYISVKEFERPVMASRIIANNVQVTYAVFAFGITAGILTVLMLVFNGVSIGAGFGLYASKGIFNQIGEFVLPHSVFELSAICIAAGGGLLIASALLLPGAYTRAEALVIKGRRAIRLIAVSTVLLLFAGTIEGLISPRTDIPLWVKWSIAGTCAIALAAYVSLGWRPGEEEPGEEFAYSEPRALISR
ncbi:MAG TPA: stage II sporulation protein M [Gemmatimonadaceae bacterium]